MDFSDEHYVKFYTRETATSLLWPWETVALFPALLKKCNKVGLVEVRSRDFWAGLAAVTRLPIDLVLKPGMQALIDDGTVERVDGGVLLPKFLEAQEARKTRSAVARDHREKQRAIARGPVKAPEPQEQRVTGSDQTELRVTGSDPPTPTPARPLPDPDPEKLAGDHRPPARARAAKSEKPPPDPRHQPLVIKLDEVFGAKRGTKYPWDGRSVKTVQRLLQRRPRHDDAMWPLELIAGWARALDARFPECKSLEDFDRDLPRYIGSAGPPERSAERAPDPSTAGQGTITAKERLL